VQSVAMQTLRNSDSLDRFSNTFGGRLRAIAVAHDVLTKTRWGGVELTALLKEILAPYRERITLAGGPVLLPSQSIVPLSMVLHELMTNAAKYGALSGAGTVALEWQHEPSLNGVRMVWREGGGPELAGRGKAGFGTMLIERVVTYDLEGSAELDFHPEGLRCTLQFPIEVTRPAADQPPPSAKAMG